MAKRRWREWPSRFRQKLNSTSGVVGVAGVFFSAAGAAAVPPLAPLILAAGAATAVGSAGWAALRSLPPLGETPGAVQGIPISLSKLQTFYPPLRTLGLVGPSLVGKSTLLDHIRLQPVTGERTEDIYAVVVALPAPDSYAAVLDGAGGEFVQQFQVAELSDVLSVIVDHNASGDATPLDPARLEEHEQFLEQLRCYLAKNPGRKKSLIHFLLNKSDLWTHSSADSEQLSAWFEEQVEYWRKANFSARVTTSIHSNTSPDDVADFVQHMVRSLKDAET